MLLPLGKLLALAIVGGGGVTAYYLTRPSSTSQQKEIKAPDCKNPYEIRLNNGGATLYMDTKKNAEEYLQETYKGAGQVSLRKDPNCPQWENLEKDQVS